MSDLPTAHFDFRQQLIDAQLLIPGSVDGVYGLSASFALLVEKVGRLASASGADGGITGLTPRKLYFPPVFAREHFEKTGYLGSFPHLTGAIATFDGTNSDHAQMLAARANGEPWDRWLSPAATVLVSAACHPVYGTLTGTVADEGHLIEVSGYCFRHEPAVDPARMQAFRMHEFVRVGAPDQAQTFREDRINRVGAVLTELGLDVSAVAANDPFFGRAGRLLAANQRSQNLKTEFVVRLYGDLDDGTAVASCNYHQDHFGSAFEISTADGSPAHSACVGFGLERIVLALLRTHGFDYSAWPTAVRATLDG